MVSFPIHPLVRICLWVVVWSANRPSSVLLGQETLPVTAESLGLVAVGYEGKAIREQPKPQMSYLMWAALTYWGKQALAAHGNVSVDLWQLHRVLHAVTEFTMMS
jgi:hypothetical protein